MYLSPKSKCHLITIKFFMYSVILYATYLVLSFYIFEHKSLLRLQKPEKIRFNNTIKLPNVVVHLDLKGFPPKLSYLKSLFPKLKELGVTGFLIEYEDMFPYEGRLVNLSAKYAYKKPELQDFLKTVVNSGFDVIPLIQTFGHMEHVLKHEEFAHLREVSSYNNVICPSQSESRMLIKDMLKQVIKFHQSVFPLKYFHIGSDEVYHINKCNLCKRRKKTDTNIFLRHVKATTDYVKKLIPNITVLIWDDMLREMPLGEWKTVKNLRVNPVYWNYSPNPTVSHVALYQYYKKFESIWIASAFKGADGSIETLPNLLNRFSNNLNLMRSIQNYKFGGEDRAYSFKGIILTGWSRYSHESPPCELLPVAIPSLFLNLLLIKKFKEGYKFIESHSVGDFFNKNLNADITGMLDCSELITIMYFQIHQCSFDGDDVYKMIVDSYEGTTFSEDCINHADFDEKNKLYNKCVSELNDKMTVTLSRYYDKELVTDYVNYTFNHLFPIQSKMSFELENVAE